LYEDEEFPQRELAALVVSKVIINLILVRQCGAKLETELRLTIKPNEEFTLDWKEDENFGL